MGGVGKVTFSISSKVPQAQEFFNQGVGQLHGFWYFEAERSFRQVAALDPDCAMAYWGMAMANVNNQRRARGFIAEAVKRKGKAGRRETMWIDALDAYLKTGSEKDRRRKYVRDLEAICHEFPTDIEAKAFLALQIYDNGNKQLPINSHQAVDSIISEVLAVEPMHPAHHYRIHLWDNEKPLRALRSAALCGQASPAIAHQWHMPGHTYSKLQRYADAAWQQEASARVDHAHMMRDRIMPDQIHNYAHNNEWLIRDLSHVGRVRDAIDLAKNMIELPRHPKYNRLGGKGSAQFGRTRLFDVLVLYELWDELLALSETVYLEPTDVLDEQVKQLRYVGVAYFSKGDIQRGLVQTTRLEAILAEQKAAQQRAGDEAEAKAREEKKPDDEIAEARKDAMDARKSELSNIENALADLRGRHALASAEYDKAFEQFKKSKGIGNEFLSRAHLQAGDKAKAEERAQAAVRAGKNQVYPLANLVEVLHVCGKASEASKAFSQLRELSAQIDLSAPVFQRLKPIAAECGLPEDWRAPIATPDDVGQRPDLASLGPFRWAPSPAADWSLPAADGTRKALSDYRGKPVVVLFYLGFGCAHCVQQLNAFGPMRQQYADAGISLVAVSTDSAEAIARSLESGGPAKAIDIPLLSDEQLSVFKAYRVYDDFEKQPLHGTFLIDAAGQVRWQDISYEPFQNAKFLLGEAKRLISQPN
jgi:peroxiredoxin